MKRTALVFTLAVTIQLSAFNPAVVQDQPRFRSGVELVHILVTVTGGDGRFVAGLRQEDFRISENGTPQVVSYFSHERTPVSLGILLDASGSMDPRKLQLAKTSINRLITDLLPQDDELFFVEFAYNAALTQEWTSDRALIRRALRDVERPTGDTRMYDAINFALPVAQEGRHARKALLVRRQASRRAMSRSIPFGIRR